MPWTGPRSGFGSGSQAGLGLSGLHSGPGPELGLGPDLGGVLHLELGRGLGPGLGRGLGLGPFVGLGLDPVRVYVRV